MNFGKLSLSLILALLINGITTLSVVAQSIVNVSPRPNSSVPPNSVITGNLKSTDQVSIPVNSVKIFVDGKDVTPQSGINSTAFSYRPQSPLSVGTHTARVEFMGSDGIGRFVTWTFDVAGAEAIALESISHNATNGLTSGSVFQTTIRGSQSQKASVLLIRSDVGGQSMQEIPAREVSPGEYVASFTVGQAPLNEGIVVGRLQGSGNVAYAVADTAARFNPSAQQAVDPSTQMMKPEETTTVSVQELTPTFTNYQSGDRIKTRNGFTLKGQTSPGANVRVKVNSSPRGVGGFLGSLVGGTVLVDQTLTADQQGNFEVPVPSPLLVQKGTRYQVEAIAESGTRKSSATVIELIQD